MANRVHRVFTDNLRYRKMKFQKKIRRCNLSSLHRFAHEVRKRLSQGFLETRAMRISEWQAVSELLVIAQSLMVSDKSEAGIEEKDFFEEILAETSTWSKRMLDIEDLQTGRYRLLKTGNGKIDQNVFVLKYLRALRNNEAALGLAKNLENLDDSSLFEYEHIESASSPTISPDSTDLGDFFQTLWPLTLTLRHALRSHWRTTQMYDYHPNLAGLSVLAGYFIGCDGGTCRIPAEKIEDEIIQRNKELLEITGGVVTAEDFVEKYVHCLEQPPVLVDTSDGWLFDGASLLVHLLYLQGEPSLAGTSTPSLDEPLLDKMRGRAGIQFERWIREELKTLGFLGPDAPIQVHYEYDVIGVSKTNKLVILAEAKFRDINPSSVTGLRMFDQEFLADDSVFAQAQRQEGRLTFFLEHKGRFVEFLGPLNVWESYKVVSYLVTKSQPPISRYENTKVMVARDFLKAVSN